MAGNLLAKTLFTLDVKMLSLAQCDFPLCIITVLWYNAFVMSKHIGILGKDIIHNSDKRISKTEFLISSVKPF